MKKDRVEAFNVMEELNNEQKTTQLTVSSSSVKKNLKTIRLLIISGIFICIACFFALLTVNYVSNRDFRETFYNVSSLKVDNPLRVIQISDLHSCKFGQNNEKIISRITKLNPDIIICTGDIIDINKDNEKEIADFCSQLAKIAPSYYVYGNNEIEKVYGNPLTQDVLDEKLGSGESDREPEKLFEVTDDFETLLEDGGIKVLKNEVDSVRVGSIYVDVFGVLTSNPAVFWSYAGEQFSNYLYSDTENMKILAVHEPFVLEKALPDSWGDLIVCGHTHGGTVRVPLLGPLYTREGGLFPERNDCYVYGRYNVSGGALIVSSGLENNNVFRINNEPEIVIIDVNKF